MIISNCSAIENADIHQQSDDGNISTSDEPDIPDLINKTSNNYNISKVNIDFYFKNGNLNGNYEGDSFLFLGDFDNLGVLTVGCNNVNLSGSNAHFKNTAFNIRANNVILNNITLTSNKEMDMNDYALIVANGDDITISNLNINYTAPSNVEAYAILVDGYNKHSASNLKIINSTIYFEGHNDNLDNYNHPIKLTCVDSLIIENNIINSSFPLKNVDYTIQNSVVDSNFVYAIGLEECFDFIIQNNHIISNVNKRPNVEYPTLNGVVIAKSHQGIFKNNSIYMTDFITRPGVENYLYGLDVQNVNDLCICENNITIITTGGKFASGTAYPIQISGPTSKINVTKNYLYSFSNGPNIGIYSVNFFGSTEISITNNIINVTGLAGNHEWALVTGIESQDTSSEIMNNIIEVHSVNNPSQNDNLYAISYRQSTGGSHTFNIQNNLAFSDGYYAVHLLSSDNSTIVNNTLISFNEDVKTGDNSYSKGYFPHNGGEDKNNLVYRYLDYYKNYNIAVEDIGDLNYNSQINGDSIAWNNYYNIENPSNNPIVPQFSNYRPSDDYNVANTSQKNNDIDDNNIQGSIDDLNIDSQSDSRDAEYAEVISDVKVDGVNINSLSNNSQSTSSAGRSNSPLGVSQSGQSGAGKSVSKKVYELEEPIKNKEKFIPSVFIIIIAIILLGVGYIRKNDFRKGF